jgi:hypothetical protein
MFAGCDTADTPTAAVFMIYSAGQTFARSSRSGYKRVSHSDIRIVGMRHYTILDRGEDAGNESHGLAPPLFKPYSKPLRIQARTHVSGMPSRASDVQIQSYRLSHPSHNLHHPSLNTYMTTCLADGGSQRCLQILVNDAPELLERELSRVCGWSSPSITWDSPLVGDSYKEYRLGPWLQRTGVQLPNRSLEDFWPSRGPVWDALARTAARDLLLVEAKAHIPEMASPRCMAEGASELKIRNSIEEVRLAIAPHSEVDWIGTFYQYTNRLAHLYLLRVLNDLPAYLVFIYFVNAKGVNGPTSIGEWQGATSLLHSYLGLRRSSLLKYVHHIYIDVAELPFN